MTANKNKVTDRQTDRQTGKVTSSLLELLVAAKNSVAAHFHCETVWVRAIFILEVSKSSYKTK